MQKHYHILNGDALKAQFPKTIDGEIIVARECLVDGPVQAANLEEFFKVRAQFISDLEEAYSVEKYVTDTVAEFTKVRNIPSGSKVYLWFEDDLFCQVNFWFVVYLLTQKTEELDVFLIRPEVHTPYGFGGLNEAELVQAFQKRVPLSDRGEIAMLWAAYQQNDTKVLLETAKTLPAYPFILQAVEAHLARIPTENYPGRPKAAILQIMQDLSTKEFGPVFKAFHQREAIYGFGDLQVRRLWEEIVERA